MKETWTQELNNITMKFVEINILNNPYYESLNKEYEKDKDTTIKSIIDCYEDFNCYYSIYTIMDSMEDFLSNNKDVKIVEIYQHEDFEIKE